MTAGHAGHHELPLDRTEAAASVQLNDTGGEGRAKRLELPHSTKRAIGPASADRLIGQSDGSPLVPPPRCKHTFGLPRIHRTASRPINVQLFTCCEVFWGAGDELGQALPLLLPLQVGMTRPVPDRDDMLTLRRAASCCGWPPKQRATRRGYRVSALAQGGRGTGCTGPIPALGRAVLLDKSGSCDGCGAIWRGRRR